MKVDVYRNLNDDCWSVRSRENEDYGIVIEHTQSLMVSDAQFVVQPAGHQRVLETGTKNVHAFVRGERCRGAAYQCAWEEIAYDPMDADHFKYVYDDEQVEFADVVKFLPYGVFVPKREQVSEAEVA